MKSIIGNNANKIWQFLDRVQLSSAFEIEKQLSMQRQDILMALGWLAREEKIYFIGDQNDHKIMILEDFHDE
jgi:hypothetical protein